MPLTWIEPFKSFMSIRALAFLFVELRKGYYGSSLIPCEQMSLDPPFFISVFGRTSLVFGSAFPPSDDWKAELLLELTLSFAFLSSVRRLFGF